MTIIIVLVKKYYILSFSPPPHYAVITKVVKRCCYSNCCYCLQTADPSLPRSRPRRGRRLPVPFQCRITNHLRRECQQNGELHIKMFEEGAF